MTATALSPQLNAVQVRLPKELLDNSAYLMVLLAGDFKARGLAELEEVGFSQYHYGVLALLSERSQKTQGAIADSLGLDRSQLVGVLDALEDRGLVERKRDPDDRRRHVVSLTPAGKRQFAKVRALMKRLENELLAPLDASSRTTLHTILSQLASYHDPRCSDCGPG